MPVGAQSPGNRRGGDAHSQRRSSQLPAREESSISLPLNLPHSALVSLIDSPDVRSLLAEEQALRNKRTELRDALRALQIQRDTFLRDSSAHTDVQKTNEAIDALHREKDAYYARLEQLRVEQDAVSEARSALRVSSFDCTDLARAVNDVALLLQTEEKQLRRVQASHDDPQNEKALAKQVERYRENHASRLAEKEAKEALREAARQRLESLTRDNTIEERQAECRQLSQRIAGVQSRLEVLRGKRLAANKTAAKPVEQSRQEELQLRESLRQVEERLTAIRAHELPSQRFTYPVEYRSELIGPQGATLAQLQADFGVALCVDGVPNGTGFVIGSTESMRDCVDAIEAIMEHVERHSERREVHYDVAMRRHLIGPRGATVEKLEQESGARIRVRDDGVVEVTGTAGALQRAQVLMERLLDSFSTAEMRFDANKVGTVIGQGGATIQNVEKTSGLRGIRVDRATSTIHMTGSTQAIDKAKSMYSEVLGVSSAGPSPAVSADGKTEAQSSEGGGESIAILHVDERVVRAVIGHRGAHVRELERSTGTRIQCAGTTVTIVGTKEAVEMAKATIEGMRRVEVRLSVDSRMMVLLTAATVASTSTTGLSSAQSPSTGVTHCSVLEAVKDAVQCDAVVPLRAEGCVLVRGSPAAVQQAAMMLRQLMARNRPSVVRMPYLEVLRSALLRRAEGQSRRLLDQFCSAYSPLLRVELDRDRGLVSVSSFDVEEVKAAATELKALLASLEHDRVRIVKEVPVSKMSLVIGPQGATIRELQAKTGTEITVVRDDAEIQVYHAAGDQDALAEAVTHIHRLIGLAVDGSDVDDTVDGSATAEDGSETAIVTNTA